MMLCSLYLLRDVTLSKLILISISVKTLISIVRKQPDIRIERQTLRRRTTQPRLA